MTTICPDTVVEPLHADLERAAQWTPAATQTYLDTLNQIRHTDLTSGVATNADNQLHQHVDEGRTVLDHCPPKSARSGLARVVCDAATLLSWRYLDAGNMRQAWHYGRLAENIGHDSDRIETWAHASAQRANILHDLSHHESALELVQEVSERIEQYETSRVFKSWLHGQLGEAYAHVGQDELCRASFDTAGWYLGDSATTDQRDPDLPFLFLNATQLTRWKGHALAVLGAPEAVETLDKTLESLDSAYVRANASLLADLALAHLSVGNHGQAQHYASLAAEASETIESARNLRRAFTVLHHLGEQ